MPAHDIVLKTLEPMLVLSIRENAPAPEAVGALLGEACGAIMHSGQAFGGAPLVIFHDPEFKPENLDVEVVVPMLAAGTRAVPLDGGRQLAPRQLNGADSAACLLHAGPFDTIAQSYEALGQWIEANGYQMAGPPREVYLRAPDDEGGALTEIQWPVARA